MYSVSILSETTNYVHLSSNGWVFRFGNLYLYGIPGTDAYLMFTCNDIKIPYDNKFIETTTIDLTNFNLKTST